jgi:hypothetical protein
LPIILHTQYADAVRSLGLLKGVTKIVSKGDPLIPVVLALIGSRPSTPATV